LSRPNGKRQKATIKKIKKKNAPNRALAAHSNKPEMLANTENAPKYRELIVMQTSSSIKNDDSLFIGLIKGKGDSITQAKQVVSKPKSNVRRLDRFEEVSLKDNRGQATSVVDFEKRDLLKVDHPLF
jgi:uncharacterized protein YifE (UPF0438 family)